MNSNPTSHGTQAITCVSQPVLLTCNPSSDANSCLRRTHAGETARRPVQQSNAQGSDADLPVHAAHHGLLARARSVASTAQDPLRGRVLPRRRAGGNGARRGRPRAPWPERDGPNGRVGRRALVNRAFAFLILLFSSPRSLPRSLFFFWRREGRGCGQPKLMRGSGGRL